MQGVRQMSLLQAEASTEPTDGEIGKPLFPQKRGFPCEGQEFVRKAGVEVDFCYALWYHKKDY